MSLAKRSNVEESQTKMVRRRGGGERYIRLALHCSARPAFVDTERLGHCEIPKRTPP